MCISTRGILSPGSVSPNFSISLQLPPFSSWIHQFSDTPKIFLVISSFACPPPPVSMTTATGHRWGGGGAGGGQLQPLIGIVSKSGTACLCSGSEGCQGLVGTKNAASPCQGGIHLELSSLMVFPMPVSFHREVCWARRSLAP